MTVSSTTNRKSFTGDDVTVAFGTSPVVFFDDTDLEVYLVTTATGASVLQTLTTDYTVSGGAGSTGTVTMLTAPASTETLVILRVLPFTQTDDFINNDINDAEVLEDRLDKLTMLTQQLDEVDARALKLGEAETASAALTELPFDRASKFLAFDASKNMIASADPGGYPASVFMATVLDDTTAAAARTTLDTPSNAEVQDSELTHLTSASGTNTITATATPTPAAYAAGQMFEFIPAATNTGATTLNVSSLGAKNVFFNGKACVGGEITISVPVQAVYDGTQFNIIGGYIQKNRVAYVDAATGTGSPADTNENNLKSTTIPAGRLSTNGDQIHFVGCYRTAANTTTKKLRIYFGTTQIIGTGDVALNANNIVLEGWIIRTGAATQVAYIRVTSGADGSTLASTPVGMVEFTGTTETLANALTLKTTVVLGAGAALNDVIQDSFYWEYISA